MGSLMEEENMIIATDGSFKDNEGGIGIVTEKGEKINMNAFAAASSFDCEIQAIYIACKMTKGNIQILTDSMASIKIIEGDRKTNNPYVKAIRKEKQRITLRHIKSHQVETQQMTHEEKVLIQLNNEADIEANRGRKNRNKTKAIPPAQELDRYLFTFNEKIIYDKIDTILYSEIFKEEVAKANLNAFSKIRKSRIIPKNKTITKNQINIATRAAFNSLPTNNIFTPGNGCPIRDCKEEENTQHAIFNCKKTEYLRERLWRSLEDNIQQITKKPLETIRKILVTHLKSNTIPKYSTIYIGILPKEVYQTLEAWDKAQEIQIEIIKFTHAMWIERCNHIHQPATLPNNYV
ncbi:predicted protein [Naegleria gruberi]|uniref:Predicted protein n=1 Tax=Naegleria gruberi TaxID=5762 RepID=D2VVH6_NAEGR|nr:uncharacterized protein NAEGRDRAFT_52591 [Naegleria gruberi]EFC39306.1 predicted protein [Naegleria gruberi]|eukprot:XP_002672050.1 predicted protein [Naegleria gruberi strain NEG-M]